MNERFDIIQVRNELLRGFAGWLAAKWTGARFVYQLSFPFPEALIQSAQMRRPRTLWLQIAFAKAQIYFRTWLMKRAALVLAISEQMRQDIIVMGVRPECVTSFPLGTECPPEPEPSVRDALRARLGIDSSPVVVYFGTIDPSRKLDFLVRVSLLVKQRIPRTRWLFIGPGRPQEVDRLKVLAANLGVKRDISFLERVSRHEGYVYLSLATVSVSPSPPDPVYWSSSPTKAVESLAMGCPVVGTPIPDQAVIISASKGGVIVPFEEHLFAEAVVSLLRDPERARTMGESGRAFVRKYRSYEVLADQIDKRYQVLIGGANPAMEPQRSRRSNTH